MRSARIAAFMLVLSALTLLDGQYRSRRAAGGGATANPAPLTGVTITFHGALKKLAKKQILIESNDSQIITFRRSGKTKFFENNQEIKASDIDLETVVAVEAGEDNDLKLLALNVRVDVRPKKTIER